MPQISLTASMRSNLLSLQNISGQVSLTQNRLATGKKVNSAIDNPSSFYTASSLNNRARDLDALLDAMGQATSTIKAATTTLETASTFLEQASAVATQALETAIPAKEYFEELVGENGAVVTTAQELKDAVASDKETICVYGMIDLGDISSRITLSRRNQKIVGIGYFGDFDSETNKFSSIVVKSNVRPAFQLVASDTTISDLSISFENPTTTGIDVAASSTLFNLDINFHRKDIANNVISAIGVNGKDAVINLTNINVNHSSADSTSYTSGVNVSSEAEVVIDGKFKSVSINGHGSMFTNHINEKNDGKITILSTAKLYMQNQGLDYLIINASVADPANQPNRITIEKGAQIAASYGNITNYYTLNEDFESVAYDTTDIITFNNLATKMNVSETNPWEIFTNNNNKNEKTQNFAKQYSEILAQYDGLINDASYKGINLLKQDDLKVNFNEKNSASLEVKGKDMSTNALGFVTQNWTNQGDIVQTLKEISSALNSIRNYDAELGNNYSIISSRQDFTENLINILTEGADKLTLADMNEESANMLALQTRQQLAVNALSLASQASQSVLKLF